MNEACLRWALEAAEYLANNFDGDCYKVLVQMSKPTKRVCYKCGTPLKPGSNPPGKTGLCHHCSCVANGRKRLFSSSPKNY